MRLFWTQKFMLVVIIYTKNTFSGITACSMTLFTPTFQYLPYLWHFATLQYHLYNHPNQHHYLQVGWTGVMSFLTTFSFPYMLNSDIGGQGCFWIYSLVSFAGKYTIVTYSPAKTRPWYHNLSVPHNIFMAWKHRHHLHYTHKVTIYLYITMFFQLFAIFNELQCAHYSSFARQASSSSRALCQRPAERQKLKFQCFSKRSFLRLTKFHQLLLSSLPWYLFCHRISHQYCHLFQKADSSTEKESPPTPILKSDPKKLQEWSTTILRLDPKNYHIWQVTLKCFTRVIQTCCQVVFLHYNVPPTNVNSCDL